MFASWQLYALAHGASALIWAVLLFEGVWAIAQWLPAKHNRLAAACPMALTPASKNLWERPVRATTGKAAVISPIARYQRGQCWQTYPRSPSRFVWRAGSPEQQ